MEIGRKVGCCISLSLERVASTAVFARQIPNIKFYEKENVYKATILENNQYIENAQIHFRDSGRIQVVYDTDVAKILEVLPEIKGLLFLYGLADRNTRFGTYSLDWIRSTGIHKLTEPQWHKVEELFKNEKGNIFDDKNYNVTTFNKDLPDLATANDLQRMHGQRLALLKSLVDEVIKK